MTEHRYNWHCFRTVLPKKEFEFVIDDDQHISFYKEGEPIVVLQKSHEYHPTYTDTILDRLGITLPDFSKLLSMCKAQSNTFM